MTKNTSVCEPSDLFLLFESIFDLYSVHDDGKAIEEQIEEDFRSNIFSDKVSDSRRKLLKEITGDDYGAFQELFDNDVRLTYLDNSDHLEKVKPLQMTWDKFEEEIKTTNRFHLKNTIELDILGKLLRRYEKPIFKGTKYYRSRISDESGFDKDKMKQPPASKAKSGRANPTGIPYLYIADSIETTLYETRASLLDFVSVGVFRLQEDIKVINLRGDTYDPMLLIDNDDDIEDFLIHLPFINKLESELSRPNRRNDKELDYLPTQYLSEFIKSLGYDGVEYKSSLNEEGYNLAIFSPGKFECINIEVHEINDISFDYKKTDS